MMIKNIDKDRVLITSDIMFAYVMQDENVCKGVVERILGREISKISYPEGQKKIKELISDKSVILDVYFTDEEGVKYNVEMQRVNTGNLPNRSRYYHSKLDSLKTKEGTEYDELSKNYVIFICTFDLFGYGIPLYMFEKRCMQIPELSLKDNQITIFVNLTSQELKEVDIKLRNMILFMREQVVNDDFTRMLSRKVEEANIKDKEEGGPIMTLEEKTKIENKYYYEDGLQEGRKEGLQEEHDRNLREIIKLLQDGTLNKETIIERLGYTEEEIDKVLKDN